MLCLCHSDVISPRFCLYLSPPHNLYKSLAKFSNGCILVTDAALYYLSLGFQLNFKSNKPPTENLQNEDLFLIIASNSEENILSSAQYTASLKRNPCFFLLNLCGSPQIFVENAIVLACPCCI